MINTIAVVFGGRSCEHEISILSALQVMNALCDKYEVYPLYVSSSSMIYHCKELFEVEAYQNIEAITQRKNEVLLYRSGEEIYLKSRSFWKRKKVIDFVFPIMHGINGEDGCIQGMLEMLNVPYAGSDVLSSALAMSKVTSKKLLDYHDFPVLDYHVIDHKHMEYKFMPCIIKPDRLGSSIGIQVVHEPYEFKMKAKEALLYDKCCLVEPYMSSFYEVNCSVRKEGDEIITSQLEKVIRKEEILSFMDKYENKDVGKHGSRELEKVEKTIADTIYGLSKKIYETFDFKGVIRIDFIVSEDQVYVNEVNTIPGSYAFYLWKDQSLLELLESVMKESLREYALSQCRITSFHSQVLFHYNGVKK